MNLLLLIVVIGIFYWIFHSSQGGNFTTTQKVLSFDEVLYSEYGYLTAIIAKLAKSDTKICELEAELISNALDDMSREFNDPFTAKRFLKEIFEEEKSIQDNVDHVAQEFYKEMSSQNHKHQKVLEFLINLAFIDGHLHENEKRVILEVADALHMQRSGIESIFTSFENFYYQRSHSEPQKHSEAELFNILEADITLTNDEIKKAYKKVVRKYHPDIVSGKGGSKEEIEKATEKLQDINDAYEKIKKLRGI